MSRRREYKLLKLRAYVDGPNEEAGFFFKDTLEQELNKLGQAGWEPHELDVNIALLILSRPLNEISAKVEYKILSGVSLVVEYTETINQLGQRGWNLWRRALMPATCARDDHEVSGTFFTRKQEDQR